MRNPVYAICERQRRRSSCACAFFLSFFTFWLLFKLIAFWASSKSPGKNDAVIILKIWHLLPFSLVKSPEHQANHHDVRTGTIPSCDRMSQSSFRKLISPESLLSIICDPWLSIACRIKQKIITYMLNVHHLTSFITSILARWHYPVVFLSIAEYSWSMAKDLLLFNKI